MCHGLISRSNVLLNASPQDLRRAPAGRLEAFPSFICRVKSEGKTSTLLSYMHTHMHTQTPAHARTRIRTLAHTHTHTHTHTHSLLHLLHTKGIYRHPMFNLLCTPEDWMFFFLRNCWLVCCLPLYLLCHG